MVRSMDVEALEAEIRRAKARLKLPEGVEVVSCYKAGRTGSGWRRSTA